MADLAGVSLIIMKSDGRRARFFSQWWLPMS